MGLLYISTFYPIEPRGYFNYHKVNIQNFYMVLALLSSVLYGLLPCSVSTDWFCITVMKSVYSAVRTGDLNKAVLQHKLIGFYNRDEKCLQRGTD